MATTKKTRKPKVSVRTPVLLDEDGVPKPSLIRTGAPKNPHYLPWEEAREFIRNEMIPSRTKYEQWWNANKPKTLPRFPYRVYTKHWVSWNDFLGTNNKFNQNKYRKFLPYEQGCLWAHTLKLQTQQEWIDYCKDNKPPENIPIRPDLTYPTWRSWSHWLGNKAAQTVEINQQVLGNSIFYIIHEQGVPSNVLSFGVEINGITGLEQRWEREKFDIFKLFYANPAKQDVINKIIASMSTPYLGNEQQRIVTNGHEIVWLLQIHLDIYSLIRPTTR